MSERIYTVLIAEDEPIIQQDIVNEIHHTQMGLRVVGTAYNGVDALKLFKMLKPDIIFTDIKMPMMDGLQLIKEIQKEENSVKIVVLSGYNDFEYAQQAIKLNVEDYLLKPLNTQKLVDVLHNIREDLNKARDMAESDALTATIHGLENEKSMPFQYADNMFALFLIHLGNLYPNVVSLNNASDVNEQWKKIDWDKMLSFTLEDEKTFWIVDGRNINQKFLIIRIQTKKNQQELLEIEGILSENLQKEITAIPIHICRKEKLINYQDIHLASQKLRAKIEKRLVIGRNKIVDRSMSSSDIKESTPISMIENKIAINMRNNQFSKIKEDLFDYIAEMESAEVTQIKIEKNIMQLVKFAITQNQLASSFDEMHVEYQIREIFFRVKTLKEVKDDIWSILGEFFIGNLEEQNNEILVQRVAEYMQENYYENITVKELSKRFHFNGTYLTRVFKKYKKETPIKYLTEIRINKAMELITSEKDTDIKLIAEMVGYPDSHYFSRLFKNKVGKTPTEYRDEL